MFVICVYMLRLIKYNNNSILVLWNMEREHVALLRTDIGCIKT